MATVLPQAEEGKRWVILNGLNDGLLSRSLRQSLIAVANTRVASKGAQPAGKTEPAKPESRFESVTSTIPLPSLAPSQNRDPKQQAADVAGLAIAKAHEARKGAQPAGNTEPPKLQSRFESTIFKMALPSRPRPQNRDPMGLTADVPSREEFRV